MNRLFRPALAVLLVLAVGCGFERRPTAENGDTGGAAAPPSSAALRAAPGGESGDAVRSGAEEFFRHFQEARREARLQEIRALVAPGAVLVHGSRRLSVTAPEAELRDLLAPEEGDAAPEPAIEEVRALPTAVLFVVRYPPAGPGSEGVLESVLVAADSSGWSVRFLQRDGRSRTDPE